MLACHCPVSSVCVSLLWEQTLYLFLLAGVTYATCCLDPLLTLEVSDVRGDGCFSPSAAPGAHSKDQILTFLDILLFGEEGRNKSFL